MRDQYYYRDAKAKHVIAKHVNWIDAKAKHKAKHVNWILANIVDDQPRVNYETYTTISRNINSTIRVTHNKSYAQSMSTGSAHHERTLISDEV